MTQHLFRFGLILFCFPLVLFSKVNDRQGLFFGFNFGGAYVKEGGLGQGQRVVHLRLGSGISENILLMGEFKHNDNEDFDVNTDTWNFSSQIFVAQTNFFVRPGIGLAYQNFAGQKTMGLSALGNFGYEHKFGLFAVGFEANPQYVRINDENLFYLGGSISGTFYF